MEIEYKEQGVNLDITDKCILQCPRCMRQIDGDLYKRGRDIELSEFEKIAKYFRRITFCGQMGDPIYHPKFLDILTICNNHSKLVNIHTNGYGKKEDWWESAFFLTSNPRIRFQWIFGLDGLPNESHKYRVNQDGNAVFDIMCEGAKQGLNIFWQYIVFNYNEDHIAEAEKMASDNGITLLLTKSSRWDKDDDLKPSKFVLHRDV
jgi:MoaA/NifB/PqqE/SkfB family radical SAM enzyme